MINITLATKFNNKLNYILVKISHKSYYQRMKNKPVCFDLMVVLPLACASVQNARIVTIGI